MALQDCQELERYLELGQIKRLDSYVGEIFKASYGNEYDYLVNLHRKHGGRVAIFRNHSKVFCGFGERFSFAIESSANINTNPRAENTVITINKEIALFYKEFYDAIKSFDKGFTNWKPYKFSQGKRHAV